MHAPAWRPMGRWARLLPALVIALLGLGAVVAVELVAELAAPPGVTGHHDLLAFWAAGRLILDGHAGDLYDAAALTALQRTVIPVPIGMNGYMPYINPPFAAAAFAPLAALAEPVARIVWALVNLALAAGAAGWLTRELATRERLLGMVLDRHELPRVPRPGRRPVVDPPAGRGPRGDRRRPAGAWGVAGLALAVLWIKPQFIVLPLLALILARRRRAVAATVAAGIAAVLVALPLTGIPPNATYVTYLAQRRHEPLLGCRRHDVGHLAGRPRVDRGDQRPARGLVRPGLGRLREHPVGDPRRRPRRGLHRRCAPVRPGFGTLPARAMLAAGIAVVLLINPNQFVQDCVLALPRPRGPRPRCPTHWRLPLIVAFVAVSDLTFVDLQAPLLHLFPIVLAIAVVWSPGWRVPTGQPRSRTCRPGTRDGRVDALTAETVRLRSPNDRSFGRSSRCVPSMVEVSRRRAIEDVASTLFRAHGYSATSVRDIARALDIQGPSLYAHVSSKEDVLWAIVDRAATRFETAALEALGTSGDSNRARSARDAGPGSFGSARRTCPRPRPRDHR